METTTQSGPEQDVLNALHGNDSMRPAIRKEKPVNPHHSFLFSLLCPGWGEYYSREKMQGVLTLTLLMAIFVWFAVELALTTQSALERALSIMAAPDSPPAGKDISLVPLAVSGILILFIWLWSMFRGLMLGLRAHDQSDEPPQANMIWGVAMAWFCPGAGHLYARASNLLAWTFLAASMAAIITSILSLDSLLSPMADLAAQAQAQAQDQSFNPFSLVARIRHIRLAASYDTVRVLGSFVRLAAIAHTMTLLFERRLLLDMSTARRYPRKDDKWLWAMGVAGLGWLCPGCGQIIQGRQSFGMALLSLYALSRLSISVLLANGQLDAPTLARLDLLPTFLLWAALIEAFVWQLCCTNQDGQEMDGMNGVEKHAP